VLAVDFIGFFLARKVGICSEKVDLKRNLDPCNPQQPTKRKVPGGLGWPARRAASFARKDARKNGRWIKARWKAELRLGRLKAHF